MTRPPKHLGRTSRVPTLPSESVLDRVANPHVGTYYVVRFTLPEFTTLCPITGLSTRDESHDVARCVAQQNVGRILIVTSDYHTRRALSIFRHEMPGTSFSIAAAHDSSQFGVRWWTHRQWAKVCLDEWLRLFWWTAIERWR